ncbi:MAG TPA: PH domain-containing protein [Polyangiaceae bacterium]
MLEGEQIIWEGRPDWRVWPGLTILGWILAPVLVGFIILGVLGVRKKSRFTRITSRRIESELGWMSRKVETLEMWKIRDVEFSQSTFQRMLGVGTLTIQSHDDKEPKLLVEGVPGNRDAYEKVMNAVMAARQQRGVLNLNP